MERDTLLRLALKAMSNRNAVPVLVDLDPVLADLGNAMANPGRKWSLRLTDWCNRLGLPIESLDALKAGVRAAVDDADRRKEREAATEAYRRFAGTLKGLGAGLESHLAFGPDYACDWLRKANLPALIESLPKFPTPTELKVTA